MNVSPCPQPKTSPHRHAAWGGAGVLPSLCDSSASVKNQEGCLPPGPNRYTGWAARAALYRVAYRPNCVLMSLTIWVQDAIAFLASPVSIMVSTILIHTPWA